MHSVTLLNEIIFRVMLYRKKKPLQRHFSNDHDKCYADIKLNFLVIRFIDALMESLEALKTIFAMK